MPGLSWQSITYAETRDKRQYITEMDAMLFRSIFIMTKNAKKSQKYAENADI